jgi:hypothetical protein
VAVIMTDAEIVAPDESVIGVWSSWCSSRVIVCAPLTVGQSLRMASIEVTGGAPDALLYGDPAGVQAAPSTSRWMCPQLSEVFRLVGQLPAAWSSKFVTTGTTGTVSSGCVTATEAAAVGEVIAIVGVPVGPPESPPPLLLPELPLLLELFPPSPVDPPLLLLLEHAATAATRATDARAVMRRLRSFMVSSIP